MLWRKNAVKFLKAKFQAKSFTISRISLHWKFRSYNFKHIFIQVMLWIWAEGLKFRQMKMTNQNKWISPNYITGYPINVRTVKTITITKSSQWLKATQMQYNTEQHPTQHPHQWVSVVSLLLYIILLLLKDGVNCQRAEQRKKKHERNKMGKTTEWN